MFQEVYVYSHVCTTQINSSTHSHTVKSASFGGVWRRRIVQFIQDPDTMQFIDSMQITAYLSQPQEIPKSCFFQSYWNKLVVLVKMKLLSHVQLLVTTSTVQSMEFSRPEYWMGWPFSSPLSPSSTGSLVPLHFLP